ncbi:hypothetical protein Pelo_4072 [Pelomyxa schiedti]|nr:hypothetical protein Pelo_4072 [Pelomyxa schiedti]
MSVQRHNNGSGGVPPGSNLQLHPSYTHSAVQLQQRRADPSSSPPLSRSSSPPPYMGSSASTTSSSSTLTSSTTTSSSAAAVASGSSPNPNEKPVEPGAKRRRVDFGVLKDIMSFSERMLRDVSTNEERVEAEINEEFVAITKELALKLEEKKIALIQASYNNSKASVDSLKGLRLLDCTPKQQFVINRKAFHSYVDRALESLYVYHGVHILDLPPHIILMIADNLNDTSLMSFRRVCTRFKSTTHNLVSPARFTIIIDNVAATFANPGSNSFRVTCQSDEAHKRTADYQIAVYGLLSPKKIVVALTVIKMRLYASAKQVEFCVLKNDVETDIKTTGEFTLKHFLAARNNHNAAEWTISATNTLDFTQWEQVKVRLTIKDLV